MGESNPKINMRYRFVILSIFAIACVFQGNSQIKWLASEYDFGTFKEIAGPKTGFVRFVNEGKTPTIINRVRTSCGCTDSSYTEGLIAPGDTATISFTYDPSGRPGRFEKTVRVYIGKEEKPKIIHIYGTVIGTPESLQKWYPVEIGPLRLSEKILTTGEMTYGQSRHIFLQGYNLSSDTIFPAWRHNSPSISMGISDKAVAPGDGVTLSIYFNSRKENAPGKITYPIEIIADTAGREVEKLTVEFIADVKPDLKGVSGNDLAKAPLIKLDPTSIELGEIKNNNPKSFKFNVANIGVSPLHIKRIYSMNERVSIKRFPVTVKPGGQGECQGSLSVTGLNSGPFRFNIEIVTDDPLKPIETITITGIKK